MIETVFLDWLLSLGAGLLFGLLGARTFQHDRSRLASRAFRLGLVFEVLVLMPVSIGLYAISPEWMWMYWVDPGPLPAAIVALAFVMYVVAFTAGFLVAPELERLRRRSAWMAVGAVGAAILALEVLAWDRLTSQGSFAEFAAGAAGPVEGGLRILLAIGLPLATVTMVIALRAVARGARSAPSAA